MRFIAFFAFVTTASAITSVFPSTNSNCKPLGADAKFSCGDNSVIDWPDIAGAKIVYDGQTVIFYDSGDEYGCEGRSVSVDTSIDCYKLPFLPDCVRIVCGANMVQEVSDSERFVFTLVSN